MVNSKFGRCTICYRNLCPDDLYILKNCSHIFHQYCINNWIKQGAKTCPQCKKHSTLTDIIKYYVEESNDDSTEESDNEFSQSSSATTTLRGSFLSQHCNTPPINVSYRPMKYIQVIISDINNVKMTLQKIKIYRGRQLEDFRTLSSYKIGNNTIIDLLLRQKGGK
ncbi:hypothetical protein Mgra_00000711 [Meloidogyne graminicola]|uniref:RING-type domain-containing protein n=1 Tax=Meloidogyne graminicola TaxID=189291 RepID=A0A8T0A161_9BILA|nr:hypothetical protein Mgra_00000711 [Meloidogyne graminicola]